MKITVEIRTKEKLVGILQRDAEFLARCNIIDYSLLIGVIDNGEDNNALDSSRSEQVRAEPFAREEYKATVVTSTDGKQSYLMGIIDTFTNFGALKKSEALIKGCFLGKGVSCVHPDAYSARFHSFLKDQIEESLEANQAQASPDQHTKKPAQREGSRHLTNF